MVRRALLQASSRLQERSGRFHDGSKSAPGDFKTTPRALREAPRRPKSAPGGLETAPGALQEAPRRPKSAPGGFKTASGAHQEAQAAPRALWEASRRRTQAFQASQSGSFLKSIFVRPRGCSRSPIIKPTRFWGSTSPKVGIQKHIRRTCSIPLRSIQQASGRLSPCMSMHGSTLVYIYISLHAHIYLI